MGFFGAYLFADEQWSDVDLDAEVPRPAEPWMLVVIHDSDFASVRYAPVGEGAGEAFLGFTPRAYFGDESASEATEPEREARGLAAWATEVSATSVDADSVHAFLAGDDDDDESDDLDDDDLDDEDVFVEIKCAHFLAHLGLPLPADLAVS